MTLIAANGCLTPEASIELAGYADLIECECPHHLLQILSQLRDFESYTASCITKFPKDAPTHKWLASSAINIDKMLSTTIIQLARREGFVDEDNNLIPREQIIAKRG